MELVGENSDFESRKRRSTDRRSDKTLPAGALVDQHFRDHRVEIRVCWEMVRVWSASVLEATERQVWAK